MNNITKDILFMQKALLLAKQAATLDEVPIGALVVLENKIIGSGYNCPITTQDPTAHAEIVALRNAAQQLNNYRLPNVTLYTTLEPCLMCVGAMLHARIQRLVFGASDPKAGVIISNLKILETDSFNHKINFTSGVLESECGKILKNFFQQKRKNITLFTKTTGKHRT